MQWTSVSLRLTCLHSQFLAIKEGREGGREGEKWGGERERELLSLGFMLGSI